MSLRTGYPVQVATRCMKNGAGRSSVTTNVLSSVAFAAIPSAVPFPVPNASATFTGQSVWAYRDFVAGSAARFQAYSKSDAFRGWPSDHLRPARRLKGYVTPAGETVHLPAGPGLIL